MTEKHVSFNVEPEHYDIVGECIIEAIKITLKDAATKEIIDAWTEGYFFLANLLIATEKKIKNERAEQKGNLEIFFHDAEKCEKNHFFFFLKKFVKSPISRKK